MLRINQRRLLMRELGLIHEDSLQEYLVKAEIISSQDNMAYEALIKKAGLLMMRIDLLQAILPLEI